MLDQNDINALLTTLMASQATESDAGQRDGKYSEVKIYDFARPDNLPSEFIRALENINGTFARSLSGMLTGYLSMGVQVELLSIDQMTYRQFCSSVPEVTALCTFSIPPLEGTALYEMNSHVAWYLIDRGLGGAGEILGNPREFTHLERGLLDDLFRRVLRDVGKAWQGLAPLRPVLRELISNPTIARIAQPDDRMVVCSFGITMGQLSGMSTYCLPVSSLDFERLLDREFNWQQGEYDEGERQGRHLLENMACVSLPVRACFPDVTMTLGELSALQPGDVLYLDSSVDEPIEVRVAGHRSFIGNPLTLKGDEMAVEIIEDLMEVDNG